MTDSGNHWVNVDDTVLSGKVVYNNQEYVLLLTPGLLVCREFATEKKGFSIPLENLTGCFADKSNAHEFHVSAVVPKTLADAVLVQADFKVRCLDAEEVVEWIETLQSVVTDRNIRRIGEQDQRAQTQGRQRDEAIGQLSAIFPDVDSEVIGSVLAANRGDVQRTIDSLLTMSDPTFNAQQQQQQSASRSSTSGPPTSTPQDQLALDEQLALALQDELFLQQINQDERFRSQLQADQSSDFSIGDKLKEMSESTKKVFGELYHKFKKATEKGGAIELPGGEEMVAISPGTRPPEVHNSDNPLLDDDEDEDVPLERTPKTTWTTTRKGYQPVPTSEEQKLFAGNGSNDGL